MFKPMIQDLGYDVEYNDVYSLLREDLTGKSILDYGFNNGNLIKSMPDIDYTYTGIELQESFVNRMSKEYPNHTFLHLNKFHPSYNPTGTDIKLTDIVNERYDIAVAWNVFTHCTMENTKECLDEILEVSDKVIFNLYSPGHYEFCHRYLRPDSPKQLEDFMQSAYWIDDNEFIYDEQLEQTATKWLFSFYNADYILDTIKNSRIKYTKEHSVGGYYTGEVYVIEINKER